MLILLKFFASFEIKFHYFQQSIYKLISSELNHYSPLALILFLIGGSLTSINPCIISMLPLTISYSTTNYNQKKVFISGLASSLISMILLIILINKQHHKLITNIPFFSSFLLISIGLNLLQILQFNFFSINTHQLNKLNFNTTIKNYLIGFILGLSSSTCSTPILTTILFWLSNSENLLLGVIYIFFYIIGYIIPLIIIIEITMQYSKLKLIEQIWNFIIQISGSTILGMGIFTLLEKIFEKYYII